MASSSTSTPPPADEEECVVCKQPLRRWQVLGTFRPVDPDWICVHIFHYACAKSVYEKCHDKIWVDGREILDLSCSRCPLCRHHVSKVEVLGTFRQVKSETGQQGGNRAAHMWPERGSRVGAPGPSGAFRFGASGGGNAGDRDEPRMNNNNLLQGEFHFGGQPRGRPSRRQRSPSIEVVAVVPATPPPETHREQQHVQAEQRRRNGTTEYRGRFCRHCGMREHRNKWARAHCKQKQEGPYPCPFPGCDKRYEYKGGLQRHHRDIHGYRMYATDMAGLNAPPARR